VRILILISISFLVIDVFWWKILVRELGNFEQRKGERSQQGDLLAKATRLDVQHTRLNKAARRRAKKAREEAKAARAIQQRTQQGDGPMQEATQEMMNTHQPSGIQSLQPPLVEIASSAASVQSHGLGIAGPGSQRFEDMLNRIWEK
jgi:hypothetical protein